MIPALIFYLIKRFGRKSDKQKSPKGLKKITTKLKAILFLVALTTSLAFSNIEEHKAITYNVVNNNEVIGSIKINKNALIDSITYTLESNINVKFLLKFNIKGREKSIYKEGKLVYSSVLRTINNKTKTNHQIVLNKGKYDLYSNKSSQTLSLDIIKQNLITLYFKEPVGVTSVFCDNLKGIVKVKPLGKSKYRVDFSNGKHNIFHYKNGKCIKIEAVSTLFRVTLIPATL